MANEFIARNGLIAQNNSTITGSLTVTGGITGSLFGTALLATNVVGTANRILFNSATNTTTTSNNLTWTDSTNLLTLGDATGTAGAISKLALYTSSYGGYGLGVSPAQLDYVSDGSHVFYKNGTTPSELVRITNAGLVGIGTTAPAEKLDVAGNINVSNGVGTKIGFNTGTGFTAYGTSRAHFGTSYGNDTNPVSLAGYYGVSLFAQGAEVVTVTTAGNVGIGTTSPSAKLNVLGDIHIGDYSSAASRVLDFRTNNSVFTITTDGTSGAAGTTLSYSWANGGQGPLKFSNAAGEVMRLTANSNVGIGTTSPGSLLEIKAADPNLTINQTTATNNSGIKFQYSGSPIGNITTQGTNGNMNINMGPSAGWGGYITLQTDTSERMRINSAGNVGIGTTTPTSGTLQVNGNVYATSFTGSLQGTASNAISSQYALITDYQNSNNIFTPGYIPVYTKGTSFTYYGGAGQVFTTAIQSDGKILVGGQFTKVNGVTAGNLVRLNPNGTVDTAFCLNLGEGFSSNVLTVAVQSDGKILVGGYFGALNYITRNYFVRLNADGTVDTSFYSNLGSGFSNPVYSIAVQSDGKIVVGGEFGNLNGATRNYLVRLNSNGTEDTSFYTNLGTGFTNYVKTIVIQPSDGKIIVGGAFTYLNGTARNYLVRLNTNGTVDTSFYSNLGSGFSNLIFSIAVQPSDGKILVGGAFSSLNSTARNYFVRLNTDGTVDTTFYTNMGSACSYTVRTIAVQSDGKILIGGDFSQFNGNNVYYACRLNSTGTLDTAFASNLGSGFSNSVYTILSQSDGKVLIGGVWTTFNNNAYLSTFVRLGVSGSIDPTDYTTSLTTRNSNIYTTANTVSIGTTSPSATLSVAGTSYLAGDTTISGGTLISNNNITNSTLTTDVVHQYAPGSYCAAMFDIHIKLDDGSFRLTQITITNDTVGNYTYTEQNTADIGNTSAITFSVVYDSGDDYIILYSTNASSVNNATLKMFVRKITQ